MDSTQTLVIYFSGLGLACIFLMVIKTRAMREVNNKLNKDERFSLLAPWHIGVDLDLWKKHRALYPDSTLGYWYIALMIASIGWLFSLNLL
jgi:hypothetical protein